MKKYQYIIAASCVLVGAAGFAGMYAMNQAEQKQQELVQNEKETELDLNQDIQIGYQTEDTEYDQVADGELESDVEQQAENEENLTAIDSKNQEENDGDQVAMDSQDGQNDTENNEPEQYEAEAGAVQEEVLHLNPDDGIMWPVEGEVLLDYSMESTIFHPTLQQYKCNPSMVFSANVNDKVYFVAKGKITDISTNEETGCTVTQDIGDGYTAIYGQLKELNFEVGDMVESGQVVGYVNEPTKYYSVEGSNVYFQLLKDGEPVDPELILP